MAIDYTKLRNKLNPETQLGGDPGLQLRTGTVAGIDSPSGAVSLSIGGATVPNVPVLGGAVFAVGTVVQVLSYRGSLLILGGSDDVSAQPVQTTGSAGGSGTVTSSTYVNSLGGSAPYNGIHGVVFVAPPSGKIMVHCRVIAGNSTVGAYVLIDFEIRAGSTIGSGTVFRAANDDTAGAHQSAVAGSQGNLIAGVQVTGLTPGAVYNAALTYRATSGTGSVNRRYIGVLPQ